MKRSTFAAAAIGLVLAGSAFGADLRVSTTRSVDVVQEPVVLEPVVLGPVPAIAAIPEPSPFVVHVPIPDSFFPFFESPPPPLPSPTIFSSPVAYPVPPARASRSTSPEDAEAIHYGYKGARPVPQLPLGYYGPHSLD